MTRMFTNYDDAYNWIERMTTSKFEHYTVKSTDGYIMVTVF